MAAIDKLLYVLSENRMNSLELEPAHTPRLRRGAEEWTVSKSTLSDREIMRLLVQVAPKDVTFPPPPPQSEMTFQYELDGIVYEFRCQLQDKRWSATAAVLGKQRELEDRAWEELMREREDRAKPIPSILDLLILLAEGGGSDLHLSSGQPPRIRVNGQLRVLSDFRSPSAGDLGELLEDVTPQRNRDQYEQGHDTDFAYEVPGLSRFRVNIFRDHQGVGAVFRTIPTTIPAAREIGMGKAICRLAQLTKGLVLVTGPTGSGKSTTLAALVDIVNRTRTDHIVTIEDPIEFVHRSRRCLVHQREVGVHTSSFKSALRSALREDPDVVLVGEMRDLETISIALETAETGHLVFGTLHTTTAVSTVDRIVDQFPPGHQEQIRMMLADTLKAVICQNLLPRLGGGRVAAREILLVQPAVSHLIREGKTHQLASVMQTHKADGMVLLNDALMDLVNRSVVDPREAYLKSSDQEDLLKRLRGADIDTDFVEFLDDASPDSFQSAGPRSPQDLRPPAAGRRDDPDDPDAGPRNGHAPRRRELRPVPEIEVTEPIALGT